MPETAFRVVAIEPFECYREAWRRIRDQYWTFFGISVVGMFLGSLGPMGVLLGPMKCGMGLCFLHKWRGEVVRFETLFKGFDYFMESFIATLIMMGCTLVIVVPFVLIALLGFFMSAVLAAQTHQPGLVVLGLAAYAVGFVVLMLLSAIMGALFAFSFLLIVDKKLTGLDAVKLGAQAAWRNAGGMVGLSLLGAVMGLAGACCCYVGALFVLPISLGATVAAYDRVFGIAATVGSPPGMPAVP